MHPTLDLSLLRTFIDICETGSFTKTGDYIGRTQAAVSQQIKRLENLVGHSLFERTGSALQLTNQGELLRKYATKLIDINDEAFLRLQKDDISGVLHLGVPEVLTATFLPDILAEFNKRHPSVVTHVSCKLSHELKTEFDQGSYDIVIFLQEKDKKNDRQSVLFEENLCWVQSKHHNPLKNKTQYPIILTPQPCIYRRLAISYLESNNLSWRDVLTAHSLSGRISAIKRGLGISLIPEYMVDDDLEKIDNARFNSSMLKGLQMVYEQKPMNNAPYIDAFATILQEQRIFG